MSTEFILILVTVSMAIWVTVSRESVKPAKEINWRKMTTFLSAGSLAVLLISISLFQSLPL